MSSDTLTIWNIRTGEHHFAEGEMWELHDDFDWYYKCVRIDGKLVVQPATYEEWTNCERECAKKLYLPFRDG